MPAAYDWALRDWQIASQAADGYLGDHVAATFHLAHYPHGHSDMDAVYFQFGTLIQAGRVDLGPMVTHRFKLDDIEKAYDLFGHQRDGVLKIAITP